MAAKVILLEEFTRSVMQEMPIPVDVSLALLIRDLASERTTGVSSIDDYNRRLSVEAAKHPELLSEKLTSDLLRRHHALITSLLSAYFAPNEGDQIMFAAIQPFSAKGFYASQKFAQTFLDDNYNFIGVHMSTNEVELSAMMRSLLIFILIHGYGIKVAAVESQEIFAVTDGRSGLCRYFQFTMDHKFCEIIIDQSAPEIPAEVLQDILAHIHDPLYGLQKLPLTHMIIRGIAMVRAFDMTSHVVMSQLKQKILSATLERQKELLGEAETLIRNLCRDPEARIAVWLRRDGAWMRQTADHVVDFFQCTDAERVEDLKLHGTAFERPRRDGGMSVDCLYSKASPTELEQFFKSRGDATLIVLPLGTETDHVGFLELTTPRKIHSHGYDLPLLREAANLFTLAVQRATDSYLARMDSVIKSNCTAIHPAVEWKFKSAAISSIRDGMTGVMAPIVFNQVFPLYAVCDIRGSSAQRSRAIQSDLSQNLLAIRKIFSKSLEFGDVSALRFLLFKIDAALKSLASAMVAGLELEIFRMINEELHPTLQMMLGLNPDLAPAITNYMQLVANDHGSIYEARKQFDTSVEMLNRELATWLDHKQRSAQSVVPHYFEKHLTDGVDHSIYVGQSIDVTGRFNEIALRNLRLWQLETMCELARISHQMRRKTPVPLDTCQLIVAQDAPLTVGFRYDERKFDVYGAYNIRYELMKKRIDKAVIKGKGERLTQPGTVAIVFSQDSERDEYLGYARYLASQGMIEPEFATLVLDDLQDVSGLQALRLVVDKVYADSTMPSVTTFATPSVPTKKVA